MWHRRPGYLGPGPGQLPPLLLFPAPMGLGEGFGWTVSGPATSKVALHNCYDI